MPVFMFLLPYVIALTVYRMYFEYIYLPRFHRRKYILKHNTGSLPMRIVFWNLREDFDIVQYGLFLSCFAVPVLQPLLWLIAGRNGLVFYYCLCLLILGVSALLTVTDGRADWLVGSREEPELQGRKANIVRSAKLVLIHGVGTICVVIGLIGILA